MKLEDACDLFSGYAWPAAKFSDEGVPIIRIQNLEDNSTSPFVHWNGPYDKKWIVNEGDLLLSLSGSIKIAYWRGKSALLNQRIVKITPRKGIDARWLFWRLSSLVVKITDMGRWSLVNNVSITDLKQIDLITPPLSIQKKIAEILDKADSMLKKDRQLLELYHRLAQSIFYDMFGDPILNEKKWDKKEFIQIVSPGCTLTYGIVQPGDEVEGGIPIVRPVDLGTKYLTKTKLKTIANTISDQFKRTMLEGHELLLSVRGSVGDISFATDELEGANVTRGIVPISMNEEIANRNFTYSLFNTPSFKKELKRMAKGATLLQINLEDLRTVPIITPPIELQRTFEKMIKTLEVQHAKAESSLRNSEALFQSLLQKAFNGELVKET